MDATCAPAGASESSSTDGIAISIHGWADHSPYFVASLARLQVVERRTDVDASGEMRRLRPTPENAGSADKRQVQLGNEPFDR